EHDTAMMIAQRESRFNPRADNNWCCYGVFQIYFEVHKGWLDDFGVYTASDLFDAEKNIAAAHHLYERAGGWGPWGF
ncbi:transglycosylase SLT domain-containing protein, partial [Ilumatobacter sp.]|uniref:transglycosylase SLT domain-containing protein n=1 Tax=Ilumatobacter sp. TaxID=1967498 RepID=UPI003AF8249A